MGIISLEKANRLFWLGRYVERTFTTIGNFNLWYDADIDEGCSNCQDYCASLGIPNTYKDKNEFIENYVYDERDINSILSGLNRAYDNAIIMRDEIKTASLAYIQMALNLMEKGKMAHAPMLTNDRVIDCIYAFWGCVEDTMIEKESRNILKCGKWMERTDLYVRLGRDPWEIAIAVDRLSIIASRADIVYDKNALTAVAALLRQEEYNKEEILPLLRSVFVF